MTDVTTCEARSQAAEKLARRRPATAGLGLALVAASVGIPTTAAASPVDTANIPVLPKTLNPVPKAATAKSLPKTSVAAVASATAVPASKNSMTYTVKAGDTVSHIALRTGTTVSAIVKANNLNSKAFIRAGQKLTIPGASQAAPKASNAKPAAQKKQASSTTYTVKSGDTLSAISTKYGTTVAAIVTANNLKSSSLIHVGQKLTIPAANSPTYSGEQLVGDTFLGRTYPSATVNAANINKATLLSRSVPSRAEMQQMVRTTALEMGVDPALAQAIAMQESGFDQRAVSPANAIGTMQVIPTSGQWASDLVGRQLDLLDPKDNVVAGVAILRALTRTSSSLDIAIASYYQGQGSVTRNGMFDDTRRYVANVRTLMNRY